MAVCRQWSNEIRVDVHSRSCGMTKLVCLRKMSSLSETHSAEATSSRSVQVPTCLMFEVGFSDHFYFVLGEHLARGDHE